MREESAEYKKLKKKIRKRDNNTCQLCSYNKKALQVHHITRHSDSVHLREDEMNLILICYYCHFKVTRREHYFAPLLKEIVMDKYKDKNEQEN